MILNNNTPNFSQDLVSVFNASAGYQDNIIGNSIVPLTTKVLWINIAGSEIWNDIMKSYGGWRYDDLNNTDQPEALMDIVNNQSDYQLPVTDLEIVGVDYLPVNQQEGDYPVWIRIQPTTIEELRNEAQSDKSIFNVPSQSPIYYTLTGRTLRLYPTPNYSKTDGLRIIFNRGSIPFSGDNQPISNNQTPGFANEYHYLQALGACAKWATANNLENADRLSNEYNINRGYLKDLYARRYKDRQPANFITKRSGRIDQYQ